MYKLRYYQEEAINSIYYYFANRLGDNPVLALPTGTGKSLINAEFIRRVLVQYPDQRIMMLTHVKELIEQNLEKLLSMWPQAPVGVYSAGLKRKETLTSIVLGGIQSVARLLKKNPWGFGKINLVIIDECHLLSPKQETQYQATLKILKAANPNLKVIGLTATPYRMKVGSIAEGEGLFDGIAYDLCSMENFNRLVDEGYLCPLIPKRPDLVIDTSKIKVTAGEYNSKSAQEIVGTEENTHKAVQEIVKCGWNRKAWLIFASGIEHAEQICEMLELLGVPAATSHSGLSIEENNQRIAAFKSGELKALVNMNKLTTGFDYPDIDLIAILRPTKSTGLWVQSLGRGTRPAPNKENCLVLDFVGNTERLGPINDPVLPTKPGDKSGPSEAPIKICEECGMYCHSSVRVCPCCQNPFPTRDKIKPAASSLELIRRPNTIEIPLEPPDYFDYPVTRVTYRKHRKTSTGKYSMRVTYFSGIATSFDEWVFFEHSTIARRKAESWWLRRSNGYPCPPTVADAVQYANQLLKVPKQIRVAVSKNPKVHPVIVDVQF